MSICALRWEDAISSECNSDLGRNMGQRSGRVGSKEKTKVSRKAQLKDKNVGRAVSSTLLGRLCKSGPSKPRTSLNMSSLLDWKWQ